MTMARQTRALPLLLDHENTKEGKHEDATDDLASRHFAFSCFRVFVMKRGTHLTAKDGKEGHH
jgi:hypothetical protein